MCLELIAEFDPFFASHISKYGNKGSGSGGVSYLSSTICNEVITIMATKVTQQIMTEVRSSKYFSIIVDSTPDISHVDQLTFVVRYVLEDGSPVERFVEFIPNAGHTGEDMFTAIETTLQKHKINVLNCRGQSYDNASNMSGCYKGLQARIKNVSPSSEYIPCSAHSLNLVGKFAAENCTEACWFFDLLQKLYIFFLRLLKDGKCYRMKFSLRGI